MQTVINAVTAAATGQKKGGDAKFFQTTKKGEIHELKNDLNSFNKDKIKDAVKKVIAAMTVGKDVSTLFTDVVKSMQTDNIELKKLVYLYIINYARSQPDKAILIVNTFQKDATDKSPLVRALAIRTMGCIRVDRITEYLCEPLSKALKDKDPYVRKTAAVCVAKLYDINKDLVEEQGFLAALRDMISDPNPMVVANAVAALAEISETSHKDVFNINANMLAKLLAALNECTEWGQVFILDCLSKYEPNEKEAEDIVERVSPRLKHANSAVAMSAVKVIMKYLDFITNKNLEKLLITDKLPPPLITLLSEQKPEIQYVALRNINLIVQKQPAILAQGVKHFFCKYNDPIYVKMEKLEIMIKLASDKNIEKVLMEFKEYATEVDVEFVRKSVLAIGRCAIKLDKAAEKCIKVLLELIQTKVNYVVQEAIIVIKDIFRKYPNRYESIIATLCENLDTLDEPEAKASMIWIIGEYADRIDNAPELLESFVEHFEEENTQVQLQLLTAVVKLFLKRPEDAKDMVASVLNMATTNSDNPDLRDRGYVYWRLLSTDPEAAQTVVLTQKPVISDDTFQLDASLLNLLISNISTLSSVYHKPPEFFVKDGKSGLTLKANKGERKSDSDEESSDEDDEEPPESSAADEDEDEELEDDDDEDDVKTAAPGGPAKGAAPSSAASGGLMDLLGIGSFDTPSSRPTSTQQATGKIVLTTEAGKGLQLRSTIVRRGNQTFMDLTFENQTSQVLSQFAIKFNDNSVGVVPGAAPGPLPVGAVAPGSSKLYSLPLAEQKPVGTGTYGLLQVAIKTELGVFYFNEALHAFHLFEDSGKVPDQEFLGLWRNIDDSKEQTNNVANRVLETQEQIKARFAQYNVFFIAARQIPASSTTALYFSIRWRNTVLLAEVKLTGSQTTTAIKSENVELAKITSQALQALLTIPQL